MKKSHPNVTEVSVMIQIHLNKEYMNSLFFDGLHAGKQQFVFRNDQYTAQLSEEEYELFMRNNNLIPYKHLLKQYENEEIIGTFKTDSEMDSLS